MRKRLSPRTIKALKPGKDGVRHGDVVMDDIVENFGVRILGSSEKPKYSFVYVGRFPGAKNPTRAALAPFVFDPHDERVAAESLKNARSKARKWLNSIEESRDPRIDEERERQAEVRKANSTFGAVCEDWFTQKLPSERRGKDVEKDIRREFMPRWKTLPIADITDEEIIRVVKLKARTAPAQARNLLGHARRLFEWAKDQRVYGLKVSPAAGIKPVAIVGKKIARNHVLEDEEVFTFWRAASRMPYPAGPVYQLLILTGLRLNEVAEASWKEFSLTVVRALRQRGDKLIDWSQFDQPQLVWTIPAARMKGQDGSARAHQVPLTIDMLRILESLPMFAGGDYLFSHSAGRKPAVMSADVKKAVDSRMQCTLRAMARKRGEDPGAIELRSWRNHDLRRVVRSGLSRLRIPEEVREAVLAHVRGGIKGVYDQHDYYLEKLDALNQWGARLRSIVEPPPAASNVVALRG